LLTSFSLFFSELSLVGLALDVALFGFLKLFAYSVLLCYLTLKSVLEVTLATYDTLIIFV